MGGGRGPAEDSKCEENQGSAAPQGPRKVLESGQLHVQENLRGIRVLLGLAEPVMFNPEANICSPLRGQPRSALVQFWPAHPWEPGFYSHRGPWAVRGQTSRLEGPADP